jgi:hypothetical protein
MRSRIKILTFIFFVVLGFGFSTGVVRAEPINLIPNPSLETAAVDPSLPLNWFKGGWGTNSRVLTYPVAGQSGAKAVKIDVTSYTDGDAKWYFADVPVTVGQTYVFSDWYTSNIPSFVAGRYKMSNGTYTYFDIFQSVPASASWKNVYGTFTVPPNVVSVTIFHLVRQVGTITMDNFSLALQDLTPPPPTSGVNIVVNPSVENVSPTVATLPDAWRTGGWGTNTRTFTYPASGIVGAKAIRVDVSSYTNGDAKWYFNDVPVTAGTAYSFSDSYLSTTKSEILARFMLSNGSYQYVPLATLPASPTATVASYAVTAPSGAVSLSVFHLIASVGSLTIDNVSVTSSASTLPKKLWGAYPGNLITDAAAFESMVGKTMDLQSTFRSWTDSFPTEYGPTVRDKGKTLVVFWEQFGVTLDDIIAGRSDAVIRSFAAGAKSYGGPVILAPFHEMNGNWDSWSGTVGTNTPAKIITAWRRIHDLFAGVPNVKFALAVNSNSVPDTAANDITQYYPGDAYVDIVAIDGFNNANPSLTFDQIFNRPLQILAQYNKPIYILSMGTAAGTTKPSWITDALTIQMARRPEIVGWVWFNVAKEYDWRVNSDAASLTAFKTAIAQ